MKTFLGYVSGWAMGFGVVGMILYVLSITTGLLLFGFGLVLAVLLLWDATR